MVYPGATTVAPRYVSASTQAYSRLGRPSPEGTKAGARTGSCNLPAARKMARTRSHGSRAVPGGGGGASCGQATMFGGVGVWTAVALVCGRGVGVAALVSRMTHQTALPATKAEMTPTAAVPV